MRLILAAAAIAVGFLVACQTPTPTPSWQVPDGVNTAPINGYPMAFRTVGTGPTVVLVHGVLCDFRCWTAQFQTLSKDFRLVAPSLRHSYPEPWKGEGKTFSMDQHAKDLAAFIEGLGEGPIYLIGHSYGGRIAYEAARARPESIKKLVLVEAPMDFAAAPDGDSAARKQRAEQLARVMNTDGTDAGLSVAIDAINGPGAWARAPENVRQLLRANAWTVVGAGRDDPPQVRCNEFGSLKMPVLLVQGENTTDRFRNAVAAQSKCLPQAQVVQVPKAGHPVQSQNPAGFNQVVAQFLKQ